jgi:hypothetical protein
MFLVTALESANVATIDQDELYLEFTPQAKHLRDTLAKPENIKILREACRVVRGVDTGVHITVKDPNVTNDAAPLSREEEERLEKQRLRQAAEQHPIVQQMLRTFRGEIADVRRIDRE